MLRDMAERSTERTPVDIIAELHAILGRMQAEGAMDEEGPFLQHIMQEVSAGRLAPHEALRTVQKKLQSRGNYH